MKIIAGSFGAVLLTLFAAADTKHVVSSPSTRVAIEVASESGSLNFRASMDGRAAIATSPVEHRNMPAWADFNATFPFARMLAGHADYTPVIFGERRKETSWAHQIASAAILTSPLLVYGAHPASMLDHPASEMIRSMPSVWDDTRVLPPSEIGELALFARRSGDRWFVAAMNGPAAKRVTINLSFLGTGRYDASIVKDKDDDAGAVELERRDVTRQNVLTASMRAGGGFIARFSKRRT